MFRWRETVRSGNATAVVKNYDPNTGFLVLMDVNGTLQAGMTITGDVSGDTLTLSAFTIADEYDLGYDYTGWEPILPVIVTLEDGDFVTLVGHSDATAVQEADSTDMVTI